MFRVKAEATPVYSIPPANGTRPLGQQWAQDPEALIVFTLEVTRDEPRLFDELLDWMLHNEPRLSVRRLRAMCLDESDRRLTDAAIRWLARHRVLGALLAQLSPDTHD